MPTSNLFRRSPNALRRDLVLSASAAALCAAILAAAPAHAQAVAAAAAAVAETQPATPAGGNGLTEVVVTAKHGAEEALAIKQSAVVSSQVISAEQIAQRPVSNVVEAVSILPGVSTFADNGLGQATTGNPEFINLRGLAATYDVDEINGVRVPATDPTTRAVSLKMLPPFGIQAIEIDYSHTADQDGDAIGGQVNFRTPTAYDFAGPLFKFDVIGTLSELSADTGFGGGGGGGQIQIAQKFADDRFGVYVTGYYQRTNNVAETTDVGGYAPTSLANAGRTDWNGVPLTANQFRWDFYTHQITSYGGNISLDYRTEGQTFYVKAAVAEYDDQGVDSQSSVREQTGPNYMNLNPTQTVPGTNTTTTSYDANGVYDPNSVGAGHYLQLRDQVQALDTVKIGGSTERDRWTVNYNVNGGYGVTSEPNYVQGSSYGMPLNNGRFIINSTANGMPNISYDSPATANYLFSQSTPRLWKFQGNDTGSYQNLYGGKLDVNYRVGDGLLKSVSAGIDLSQTNTQAWNHYFVQGNNNYIIPGPGGVLEPSTSAAGPTVANQPGQNVSGFLGYGGTFRANSRGSYVSAITPVKYQSVFVNTPTGVQGNPGAYTINDYNNGDYGGAENILGAYVSADFGVNNVHIYPGLRYEYTQDNLHSWVNASTSANPAAGFLESVKTNYGELLPSLNVVYKPDNNYVFRASINKSFSRPTLSELAAPVSESFDVVANGQNQLVSVSQGNPNLRPAESWNFETDAEYYSKDLALEASFYAKQISHFIYTSNATGGGPAATTGNFSINGVNYSEPQNGLNADVFGVSLSATDHFGFLPGLWRGLGVNANVTLQHSDANSGIAGEGETPLPQAPDLIYNLQLLYDLNGYHAAVTYQYQGLQLDSLEATNLLNDWIQPTAFLNLTVGYRYKSWDFTFGAKNLTNEYAFFRTLGESTKYLDYQVGGSNGNYVLVGRQFQITASFKY
jgi:TonB-dependent receptor